MVCDALLNNRIVVPYLCSIPESLVNKLRETQRNDQRTPYIQFSILEERTNELKNTILFKNCDVSRLIKKIHRLKNEEVLFVKTASDKLVMRDKLPVHNPDHHGV